MGRLYSPESSNEERLMISESLPLELRAFLSFSYHNFSLDKLSGSRRECF